MSEDEFTEAEYKADPARIVAHAAETGRAVVVRPDGSTLVVISIPKEDLVDPLERDLAAITADRDSLRAERDKLATLIDECDEIRYRQMTEIGSLLAEVQHERDHSKMLSEANSALHVEKRAVEDYCAKVRGEYTAAKTEADALRARVQQLESDLIGKTLAPTEWVDKLTAQAEGRCLGTIGFVACGEGGNYCSVACQLRARVQRLEVVWEAAVALSPHLTGTGDWACERCRPDSDMLHISPGFRCRPHALQDAIDAAKEDP